jgi:hypothetical protein
MAGIFDPAQLNTRETVMARKKTKKFDKREHLDALRAAGFVVICWSHEDMPGATEAERADQLEAIARDLEDRSVERGWEVITDLT